MALYLHCVICSRKQADGLISGAAWGRVEFPPDAPVEHPSLNGSTLRVCPSCVGTHPNWHERVLYAFGFASGSPPEPDTAR